ncbi:SAV_2336 N-terminal domain-related protein [Streptomyces sp. NPDC026659]|uniref:SAV_2336 N-terminal domain-related protein n=1 Tax=Streptomyces sp. NPDC026659 TaxID=3155123 RepID=UPI0033ED9F00
MTAPDGQLGELAERIRALGADPSARELAESLWLARYVGRPALGPATPEPSPLDPADPEEIGEFRIDYTPPAWYTENVGTGRRKDARSGDPVRLHAERPGPGAIPAPTTAGPDADAVRVRVPTATALPQPLVLQRALRPLQHYTPPVRTPALLLDEQATAEQAAETHLVLPVLRAVTRREARLRLLMDVSTSTGVWDTALGELRQICAGLGAFREVTAHYLREDEDGRLMAATSRDGVRASRGAEQLRDPTGRQLTLVLSDCAGPLWRSGRMQRLLHHWSQAAPVAVVQPLPQRMWRRTHLPALPGTLRRREGLGARLDFASADGGTPAGAAPVPVLSLSRTALGTWARLLAGSTGLALPAPAAWVSAGHPAAPPRATPRETDAETLVRAFRRSASRQAVQLAVSFSAVPLTLPVMQLVQRAMQPRSGPTVLAEVLLSGLLERAGDEGWYDFRPGVRETLLRLLPLGDAQLILKHCGDYVERHFGRRARNFPALALAGLGGPQAEVPDGGATEAVPDAFAVVSSLVAGRFGASVPAVRQETHHLVYAEKDAPWARWAAHLLASHGKEVALRRFGGGAGELRELVRGAGDAGSLRRTVLFIGAWHAEFRLINPLRGVAPGGDDRFDAVSVVRTVPFSWVGELERVTPLWDTTESEAGGRLLELLGVEPQDPAGDGPDFPGPTLRVVDGVPDPPKELSVRDELLEAARESLATYGVCTFIGGPGTGKTALAAQYAHHHASAYDVVWWVRPGSAEQRRERLANLGVEFGIPSRGDVPDRLAELRRVLRTTALRWLIVFDDCDDSDELAGQDFDGGHVLILGRSPKRWSERAPVLRLEPLGAGQERPPTPVQPGLVEGALARVYGRLEGAYTGFFIAPGLLVSTVRLVRPPYVDGEQNMVTVVTDDGRRHWGDLLRVLGQVALFRVPQAHGTPCLWITDAPDVRPDDVVLCGTTRMMNEPPVRLFPARGEGQPGSDTMRLVGDLPTGGVGQPVLSARDGSVVGMVTGPPIDRNTGGKAVRIEALRQLCDLDAEGARLWHDIVREHDRHHARRTGSGAVRPMPWQRELYGLFAELPPPAGPGQVRSMMASAGESAGDHPPRSWRDGAGLEYARGGHVAVVRYAAQVWNHLADILRVSDELEDLRQWIRQQQTLRGSTQPGRTESELTVEIRPDRSGRYTCEGHFRQWERGGHGRIVFSSMPMNTLSTGVREVLRLAEHRFQADGTASVRVVYRLPDELLWELPVERWTAAALPHLAQSVSVRGLPDNRRQPPRHQTRWNAVSRGPLIGFRSPPADMSPEGPVNAVPLLCLHTDGAAGTTALRKARDTGYPLILWSRAPGHETCLGFFEHMREEVRTSAGADDLLSRVGSLRARGGRKDDWTSYVAAYFDPGSDPAP